MKRSALTAVVLPAAVETVTSTTPAVPGGDVAEIWVGETVLKAAEESPNLT